MKGVMVVADDLDDVDSILAESKPTIVKEWTMEDFKDLEIAAPSNENVMRGMIAFAKANCNQCHVLGGHARAEDPELCDCLGPDLKDVTKKYQGSKLLKQLLEPSSEINEKFQTYKFLLSDGRVVSGVINKTTKKHIEVMANLLTPGVLTRIEKDQVDEQLKSKISAMPPGMLNVLTKQEITDLLTFLQSDGYQLPEHLLKEVEMSTDGK